METKIRILKEVNGKMIDTDTMEYKGIIFHKKKEYYCWWCDDTQTNFIHPVKKK